MEIRKVSCNMGRTINAGNYESFRVDVSGEAVLAEGEDAADAMASLRTWVSTQLAKAIPLAKGTK